MGKGNKLAYYDGRESPHYLTIYRPYPMNASMDIEADRIVFSYWVASCIGRENLLAFFHKPKVRDLFSRNGNASIAPRRSCHEELSWVSFA